MEHLFFYGTLRPGAELPPELSSVFSRLKPVGTGFVRGLLHDLGEYPGLLTTPSSEAKVIGEIFVTEDASVFPILDAYEGFNPHDIPGSLFVRTLYPATLQDGRELQCWLYVYNRDPGEAPVISGGDYAQWREVNKQ